MLRLVGVEVPDTRAWRLESMRDVHPLVDALLTWRKAERIAHHVRVRVAGRAPRGRRPAAGRVDRVRRRGRPHDRVGRAPQHARRPARAAVIAEARPRVRARRPRPDRAPRARRGRRRRRAGARRPGRRPVRPRRAAARRRPGDRQGRGARRHVRPDHRRTAPQALRGLQRSYPVAMAYLDAADRGRPGGPRPAHATAVGASGWARPPWAPTWASARPGAGPRPAGRYGRNAMVQGAAAELFKVWAVTVRARGRDLGARIVLCLHDELLVHAPTSTGPRRSGSSTTPSRRRRPAGRPDRSVRFVAETRSSRAGPTRRTDPDRSASGLTEPAARSDWCRTRPCRPRAPPRVRRSCRPVPGRSGR